MGGWGASFTSRLSTAHPAGSGGPDLEGRSLPLRGAPTAGRGEPWVALGTTHFGRCILTGLWFGFLLRPPPAGLSLVNIAARSGLGHLQTQERR